MDEISYKDLSEKKFHKLLVELQNEYTNSEDDFRLSDEEFDFLVDTYEKKFGKQFLVVGAKPNSTAVELPYKMPSLSKIKISYNEETTQEAEKKLALWLKNQKKLKNVGNYVLEDKLDGVSLLYISSPESQNLYTRGDGEKGEDKSHLLKYMNLPIPDHFIAIRGEIVLDTEDFEEYVKSEKKKEKSKKSERSLKKPRNIVSGLINSKTSLDIGLFKKCKFYAYSTYEPSDLTPEGQLKLLKKMGFNVPWSKIVEEITKEKLSKVLKSRKNKANYDIDGIVILKNIVQDEISTENPKNAFAFKIDTIVESFVIDMVWRASSKDGYLTPVVYVEPREILGSEVKKASGYNARFVFNNKIGIGSRVLIGLGGDIIPRIYDVLEPSNEIIYPTEKYKWNSTKVDFVLENPETDKNVIKARIVFFAKTLGIKDLGPERVSKIYKHGYDTIEKLIKMKPKDIEDIDNLGKKSSVKICENISAAITDVKLETIMTASCIFGEGFGETLIKKILEVHDMHDLEKKSEKEIYLCVLNIDGFAESRSKVFSENFHKFLKWLEKNKKITIKQKANKTKCENNVFCNLKITFSGTRATPEMKKIIEESGGEITNSVTKQIDILVIKDSSMSSTINAEKAKKYGKEIFTMEEFQNKYNL